MEDNDVLQRLTRIETKLDQALACNRDHENRLRSVESRQWYVSGAAFIVGFIVTKLPWSMHIG